MFTTNDSTFRDPVTYSLLREGCEKLLKLAKDLEEIAHSNPTFFEDPRFTQKKKDYRQQYIQIQSLGNA